MDIELREKMDELKGKYGQVEGLTVEKFNRIVRLINLEFQSISGVPKFIISRSIYTKLNSDEIDTIRVIIRPTIQYKLTIHENKELVILKNTSNIFNVLIDSIYSWIIRYYELLEYENILEMFNNEILKILQDIKSPYTVIFKNGKLIESVSDNSIIIGLTLENIKKLKELDLFSKDTYWSEKYRDKLRKIFKSCNMPYDLIKSKNDFTDNLGIYTRKSIYKVIRKTVNRKIENVRVGIGFIETDTYFAIIEKKAVTSKEIEKYVKDNILILDNKQASIKEKNKCQNKIVVSFVLSPLDKKTGILLNLNLNEIGVNENV